MYTWDSRVRFSEIGEDKKLTLDSILNYFQDSSTFHSEDIGNGMEVVESLKNIKLFFDTNLSIIFDYYVQLKYEDKIIMASGSFTQGSTIELSCDGPIREPYIAYMQGSLTYPYGKLGLMKAIEKIVEKEVRSRTEQDMKDYLLH